MLRLFSLLLMICLHANAQAQPDTSGVDAGQLEHALEVLASDSLKGRGNYTAELKKAATFIVNSFKAAGLLSYFDDSDMLQFFKDGAFSGGQVQALNLENYDPERWLANVVAMLPGTDKPDEFIIFSAHYDHLVAERRGRDPIYNGANDNASGTAAMLALVHYFAQKNSNSRTIIFCAFAGEELGLLGSKYFVQTIDAKKVVAVINLEMLGRTAAAGKNSFFITGSNYSSLEEIVRANLNGSSVKLAREQYSANGDLFLRSDNYPFAQLGIPAHTFMSSDDTEGCYHRPCDEVRTINKQHLLNLTNGIIQATRTLVDGTERPKMYSVPQ